MSEPIGESNLQGVLKTQYVNTADKKKKKKKPPMKNVNVQDAYKKINNRTSQLNDVLSQM